MSDLIEQDDLKLLTDIGFTAMSGGMTEHALAIFAAVKATRSEGEAGYLGLGMIDILKGDPASAVKTLNAAPDTDAVKTFLGIALVQTADLEQGEQVLQSVVQNSPDTPFARIASDTLASLTARVA